MPRKTLEQLANDLAEGRATARGLVEQSLAAIADPAGEGARTFITVDREGARAAADLIDGLRKRGRAPSRFAGIPFSVKDLFDLAGEVTTAGSKVLRDAAPATADAPAIARLKARGFIVIGRTNMTEFAYSGVGLNPHYGTPRSAYDRATGRIPGGSSSGAGVSVADGMVALAIGTDTAGSCRIPASYNGIVGYKPTASAVPTAGAFPLSSSFDSIGPLANSVACAAVAHAIMAGGAPRAPAYREAGQLRLGILADMVLDALEPAVAAAFERVKTWLAAAGARFADMRFAELAEINTLNAKGGIVGAEAWQVHRQRIAASGAAYDPRVAGRIEPSREVSAADYLDYHARRNALIGLFAGRFEGFDAVLMPTTPNIPPAIAALSEDKDYFRFNGLALRNTRLANFLDGCAISIPMSGPGEGPCGLTLMAPAGHDAALFSAAAAVERELAQAGSGGVLSAFA